MACDGWQIIKFSLLLIASASLRVLLARVTVVYDIDTAMPPFLFYGLPAARLGIPPICILSGFICLFLFVVFALFFVFKLFFLGA